MVKLEEKSDGYYVLETCIGCIAVKKAFIESDKPLDEISSTPKTDGFFLIFLMLLLTTKNMQKIDE